MDYMSKENRAGARSSTAGIHIRLVDGRSQVAALTERAAQAVFNVIAPGIFVLPFETARSPVAFLRHYSMQNSSASSR